MTREPSRMRSRSQHSRPHNAAHHRLAIAAFIQDSALTGGNGCDVLASSDAPAQVFAAAAAEWMAWKRPSIRAAKTVEHYEACIASLDRFFGARTLAEILPGQLREYQIARASNEGGRWRRTGGPSTINHELNTLSQILDYADLWDKIKKWYKPLPAKGWHPPRVMTPNQEETFFQIAASDKELELAYLVASITNTTTASGKELRMLRLRDLHLDGEMPSVAIPIEGAKNQYRARHIPLNETALKQFRRAVARAIRLGSTQPDHYLFPLRHRAKNELYDPTRPASPSWLKKQFRTLRQKTGIPWLRPHDLRHQAITQMLELGVPDQTVKSIAGHVSQRMLEHYSHTRMHAKQAAVNVLSPNMRGKTRSNECRSLAATPV